jgi:hypothetical protein
MEHLHNCIGKCYGIIIILLLCIVIYYSINKKYYERMITIPLSTGNDLPHFYLPPERIKSMTPQEVLNITDEQYASLSHNQIMSFTPRQIVYIYKHHPTLLPVRVEYLFNLILVNYRNEYILNNLSKKQQTYGVKEVAFKYTAMEATR